MKPSALIPVKGFSNAKQRLSPLLTAPERELLAEVMMREVLQEVVLAQGLESTFVVTGNATVSEIARSLGACVIEEEREQGETEAVHFALSRMKQMDVDCVLIVPADIPLVRSQDIDLILEHVKNQDLIPPFALLVPSHDRLGTNALLLSPVDIIRLRFGYDSFAYHLSAVAAQGLEPHILENERIALDIDEPQDLQRFFATGDGKGERIGKVLGIKTECDAPGGRRSGSL
ncbi:MAG: 2-phospho-L-lactate guanylyltransferase [Deltaproteobacteria bacterium]|nr:2-phospho-L-lactate guanylyltransferase [Deltaproteobacteria bacterium]